MKKPDSKLLLSGLLILPLLLLTLYTFNSGKSADKRKGKIDVAKLKLSSPQDLPNEIAAYLEEGDFESALIRIEEELRDPDVPTSKGMPLIVLAAEKNTYEIAALLASMGANVNLRDERTNETAIIKAARNNNSDMIAMLLSAGADINAQNRRGVSALSESINNKNKDIMEYLTSNGARSGATFENLMRYAYLKNNVGVSAMLRSGVDPKQKDAKGNTALMISASRADAQSVEDLIAYGADVNAQNKQGMTPLLYAIRSNNRDIVQKVLLADDTDVNLSNVLGQSPLYWSAYMGDDIVVNALLTLGADYNKRTRNNQTALEIAKLNNRTKVVNVIEDFIKYKNMPRDKSGKVIIDKNAIKQDVKNKMDAETAKIDAVVKRANKTASPKKAANQQDLVNQAMQQAAGANPAAMPQGFDSTMITNMMQQQGVPPEAMQAMQQAQQGGAAMPAASGVQNTDNTSTRSKFKPKKTSRTRRTTQKTQINKLETHSL